MFEKRAQVHQKCAALLIRHDNGIVGVRERSRLLFAPGVVLPHALVLGFPAGGMKHFDETFRTTAERESTEETGLLSRILYYQGCYSTRRDEFAVPEQGVLSFRITYHVYVAELVGPFVPVPGKDIEEVLLIKSTNLPQLLKVSPWRMSWMGKALDDAMAGRRLEEPHCEVNRSAMEYLADFVRQFQPA